MTRPGTETWFPGPLANTLPTRPRSYNSYVSGKSKEKYVKYLKEIKAAMSGTSFVVANLFKSRVVIKGEILSQKRSKV